MSDRNAEGEDGSVTVSQNVVNTDQRTEDGPSVTIECIPDSSGGLVYPIPSTILERLAQTGGDGLEVRLKLSLVHKAEEINPADMGKSEQVS